MEFFSSSLALWKPGCSYDMVIKLFANCCSKSFYYYTILHLKYEMKTYTLGWILFTLCLIIVLRQIAITKISSVPINLGMIWTDLWKILVLLFLKLIYNISKDNILCILSNYNLKAINNLKNEAGGKHL